MYWNYYQCNKQIYYNIFSLFICIHILYYTIYKNECIYLYIRKILHSDGTIIIRYTLRAIPGTCTHSNKIFGIIEYQVNSIVQVI